MEEDSSSIYTTILDKIIIELITIKHPKETPLGVLLLLTFKLKYAILYSKLKQKHERNNFKNQENNSCDC
jgi:hypothetical protein